MYVHPTNIENIKNIIMDFNIESTSVNSHENNNGMNIIIFFIHCFGLNAKRK